LGAQFGVGHAGTVGEVEAEAVPWTDDLAALDADRALAETSAEMRAAIEEGEDLGPARTSAMGRRSSVMQRTVPSASSSTAQAVTVRIALSSPGLARSGFVDDVFDRLGDRQFAVHANLLGRLLDRDAAY
jgi:hypothetical protein